jgi:hypothetical protein
MIKFGIEVNNSSIYSRGRRSQRYFKAAKARIKSRKVKAKTRQAFVFIFPKLFKTQHAQAARMCKG